MKKFLALLLGIIISIMPALALDFDVSVDEEIRKKYDADKLKYDTPATLPKVNSTYTPPTQNASVPKTTPIYTETAPKITKANLKDAIKIPAGTKFQVRSNLTISDWMQTGSAVSFTTTAPVYKRYITIPSGTKIYGRIEDVHRPQKTGNGGLVVIRITSIIYNGKNYAMNGKVTKANSKKIFLNNIKGKRQYWANVGKQIDKGEAFYKKTRRTSNKLADNPIGLIISPIPTIVGLAGYTAATVLSPLTAITSTGGSLSIPPGSTFELKLLDDAYVAL